MKRLLILTAVAGLAFASPALAATKTPRTPSCATAKSFLRQRAETERYTLRFVSACSVDRSLHMVKVAVLIKGATTAVDEGGVAPEMVFGVFYSSGQLHAEFLP
jgi:hypothetical protein